MLENFILVCLILAISSTLFYIVEKIDAFRKRGMKWKIMQADLDFANHKVHHIRAKTLEVMANTRGGRAFTREEIETINKMGLGDFLSDDRRNELDNYNNEDSGKSARV